MIRGELCDRAVFLARGVASLLPYEPEAAGLLALLLTDARRAAHRRSRRPRAAGGSGSAAGGTEHDRRGRGDPGGRAPPGRPGRYQLHPAIGACHFSTAASAEATDWQQIALLHGELIRYEPTPVVEANRGGRRGHGRWTGRGTGHPRHPGLSPATAAVGPAVHRPGRAAQVPRARRRRHRRVPFGARTGTGPGVPVLHRRCAAGPAPTARLRPPAGQPTRPAPPGRS